MNATHQVATTRLLSHKIHNAYKKFGYLTFKPSYTPWYLVDLKVLGLSIKSFINACISGIRPTPTRSRIISRPTAKQSSICNLLTTKFLRNYHKRYLFSKHGIDKHNFTLTQSIEFRRFEMVSHDTKISIDCKRNYNCWIEVDPRSKINSNTLQQWLNFQKPSKPYLLAMKISSSWDASHTFTSDVSPPQIWRSRAWHTSAMPATPVPTNSLTSHKSWGNVPFLWRTLLNWCDLLVDEEYRANGGIAQ